MSSKLRERIDSVSLEPTSESSKTLCEDIDVDAEQYVRAHSRTSSISSPFRRGRSASQISTSSTLSKTSLVSKVTSKLTDVFGGDKKALKEANRTIAKQQSIIKDLEEKMKTTSDIMLSIKQMEELYTTKLDSLNDQGNVICYISKSNVQVGHNNTLQTVDVSRLNDLLVSYHDNVQSLINDNLTMKADLQNTEKSLRTTRAKLESTAVELQQTKDDLAFNLRDLEQTRAKLEETGEKLEHETLLLQEVTEDLKDMKLDGKDQTLKLEYTIGLTQSQLMVNCIEAIRTLSSREESYSFSELPEKGKLGVMRILRKYCQKDPKLTSMHFAESLGIDTDEIENETEELNQDICSEVLVKWVHMSPENDADALCTKFKKLSQYGSVRGTFGSTGYDFSVSRLSVLDTDGQTSELVSGIKAIIERGISSCKTDIKRVEGHLRAMRYSQRHVLSPTCDIPLRGTADNVFHGSTCTQ